MVVLVGVFFLAPTGEELAAHRRSVFELSPVHTMRVSDWRGSSRLSRVRAMRASPPHPHASRVMLTVSV